MPVCRFTLGLSREQFLLYYQGTVRQIQVMTDERKTVRFPAGRLRPFLTPQGIHGRFALHYDAQGRFVTLERIGE